MTDKGQFILRRLGEESEIEAALNLAEEVFDRDNAAAYTQAGVDTFRSCLNMFRIFPVLEYWGCFDDRGNLIGMLGAGQELSHLTLLFVKKSCRGSGVGRRLVETFCRESRAEQITVRAFPGSIPFYRRMGFCEIGKEEEEDGIRFVPMRSSRKGIDG